MSCETWALFSAAAWAVDSILVRKGTVYSNTSTAAFLRGEEKITRIAVIGAVLIVGRVGMLTGR